MVPGPRRLRAALLFAAALTIAAVLLLLNRPAPVERGASPEAPAAAETAARGVESTGPVEVSTVRSAGASRALPRPGARILGRVTDGEDRPVRDARIWLTEGTDPAVGEAVARTDADGRYVVDGVDGDERLVGAIATGHAPSDLRRIRPGTQAVFELDFSLRRGGGALALEFEDAPASARVRIEPDFQIGQDGYEPGGARLLLLSGEGRVVADGLEPEWNYLRIRAPGYAPVFLPVRLPPGGTVDVSVPLARGATVFGRARLEDGSPAAGAVVRAVEWEWGVSAVATDAEGGFRIEHLPAVTLEMWARASGGEEARTLLQLAEGEEQQWNPTLRPPQPISGRVVDAGGVPQPHARLLLSVPPWWVGVSDGETDSEGRFRFDRLPEPEFNLAVWRPGSHGPPTVTRTVVPGGPPLRIVLPAADGGLRGTIVTRTGTAAAGARVRAWPAGRPDHETRTLARRDGFFALEMPAGTYSVELHLDGEPTLHLNGIQVPAEGSFDLGVVRFPVGGRIRARLVDDGGWDGVDASVAVTSLDASIGYVTTRIDDAFVSEELTPGRYLVWAPGGVVEEVEVESGGEASVDLHLRGGGTLEVRPLRVDGARTLALIRVEDVRGRPVVGDSQPHMLFRAQLVSGTYRVTATDKFGRTAAADVQIPGDGGEVELVLVLR